MTILESLLLAHVLGDWILQPNWQAQNKHHSWRAMWAHVAVYHLVVLAVLVLRFGLHDWLVYAVVGGLAVTHAFLDRGWPVIWLMRKLGVSSRTESDRWLNVMFDQSIHMLLLGVAAAILTRNAML
jgi:hypothetical protein